MILRVRNNPTTALTGGVATTLLLEKIDNCVGFSHDPTTGEFSLVDDTDGDFVVAQGNLTFDAVAARAVGNVQLNINGVMVNRLSFDRNANSGSWTVQFNFTAIAKSTDVMTITVFTSIDLNMPANAALTNVTVRKELLG